MLRFKDFEFEFGFGFEARVNPLCMGVRERSEVDDADVGRERRPMAARNEPKNDQ